MKRVNISFSIPIGGYVYSVTFLTILDTANPLYEQRTAIIEDFFDYDYSLNRTQKELADALGVSSRHMVRILKKTCNKSYREKLLQSRMEVAADLLTNTGMNISSVAAQLGYTTETGFYRSFYNYFKSTPANYRKSMNTKHS